MSQPPFCEPGSLLRRLEILCIFALLIPGLAQADGLAHTVRSTEFRSGPSPSASIIATLPRDTTITVGKRRGAWFQAFLQDDTEGWVRLLSVRYFPPTASGSLLDAADRASRSETTVSTGVRGLDREMLAQSKANHARLQRLLGFGHTASEARRFAAEGGLVAREEAYP